MSPDQLAKEVKKGGEVMILTPTSLKAWRESHTPPKCPILGVRITQPVADHNHKTGFMRGVVQNEANTLMGKIENYFDSYLNWFRGDKKKVLSNIVDFIERKTDVLHPNHAKVIKGRFSREKKEKQLALLDSLGVDSSKAKNAKERAELFLEATTEKQ